MTAPPFVGQSRFSDGNSELNRTEFIARQVMNRIATATLVLVKAVDTSARTVDLQPMVAQIDGAGTAVPHGVISSVPWLNPRAGGSAVILTPVVGDIGLAVFCHSDISSVKINQKPSIPGSRRRFDWSDAIYVGGLFGPDPTQFIRLDADGIAIQAADGTAIALASSERVSISAPVDAEIEYRVAGTKVVGARQATLPANASDLSSALTLVNAIKAGLRAHGLFG